MTIETENTRERLLAAARDLDDGRPEAARTRLRAMPLALGDPSVHLVAIALWRRLLTDGPKKDATKIAAPLKAVTAAVENTSFIWNAYRAIPALEAGIGSADTAALFATVLWHRVLEAPEALFVAVFELFFRAGGERCADAWTQYLRQRRDYAPSYWLWVLHTKTLVAEERTDLPATVARLLDACGRQDLHPLFAIYLKQMRQAPIDEILQAALALNDTTHRLRITECMAGMGYMTEDMRAVVAVFSRLLPDANPGDPGLNMMQARLANADGRWRDAVALASVARADPRLTCGADLLRAHALARLKDTGKARVILDAVAADAAVPAFLHARAAFVRVTAELIERDLPLPADQPTRTFPPTVGRPLALSLWVGRRLRWIERLAIKSYLDNGWRFQLYVYDDVEGVPAGCEILDAAAIIPEREVFIEGPGSGLHAGSVGAFSDLFRYRLLHERGGMWSDTDVINLRRFDPDGMKFISTEVTDAGLITLNGAMMAAPAGDPFVARAYDRAAALLRTDKMFFTRIGPYLLAELVVEMGADTIELMPPDFLSPVSWMNTGSLLQPYEAVAALPTMRAATNLHVYTEMWRLLGLGLDRPPPPETFLGQLYARSFGEPADLEKAAPV